MPIDFYYIPGSAPCRAVLLAAKAVGVDLNLKITDLMKGEHLTPEFIKVRMPFGFGTCPSIDSGLETRLASIIGM